MGALSIRDITKSFGALNIFKGIDIDIDIDIDIEVEVGEFLILVDPLGCGKSTLLSMVAGLDLASGGEILIGDRDVTYASPRDIAIAIAIAIAMVFQSYALYPNVNVAQNIAFGLEMRKVPRAEREAGVQRVAKMLQMQHLLERKPGQLSGGQRQRVAMGRALARNPALFLFDEPLSNLDAKLRVEMRAEIKLLHHRTRTTTVYVTHAQIEAMTLGDRIAVMRDGQVEQFGTPNDICARPASRFVPEFIGSPAMNMIAASCTDRARPVAGRCAGAPRQRRSDLRLAARGTQAGGRRPARSAAPAGADRARNLCVRRHSHRPAGGTRAGCRRGQGGQPGARGVVGGAGPSVRCDNRTPHRGLRRKRRQTAGLVTTPWPPP